MFRIDYILKALAGLATLLMLLWCLQACSTTKCLPVTEYRDSIVTRYLHDTIATYEKDSIFIHAKGDTIWRERWSIRYRDKIVERHDTIYQATQKHDLEVREVVPTYYKGVSVAFWVLVALGAVATAIRVLIRVYLHK